MMSRKALGYTSAIAATLMVSYWLLSRKRRYENELKDVLDPDEDDDFNSINNPNIFEDEDQIEFILRQSFLSAAAAASSLVQSGVQDDIKLLLYGLYKQATVGDCNINAPNRFNFTAYMKYQAWNECKKMPQTLAMINYIDVVQHLISSGSSGDDYMQDDNADIYYDAEGDEDSLGDEIQLDRVSSLFSGLGHKQSTLLKDSNAVLNMREDDDDDDDGDDDLPMLVKRAMDALAIDDSESLKMCIEEGLDVNDSDDAGQKLLHFAADLGSIACIHTLLQCGANPNASDDEGISALEAAVINGQEGAAKLLLEAGANPDQEDFDGDSARTYAEKDGSKRMKKLFGITQNNSTMN